MTRIKLKYEPIRERLSSYPEIPDQIDAIFKGFVAIRDSGVTLPDATLEWVAKIEEIKTRYPKR